MLRQNTGNRTSKQLPPLPRRRVLVVDEDVDDLLYYSTVLLHRGYEVRSIPSYLDGATCLECEDFDLIIVSQGSPNFEGRRVLSRAIAKDRHTPVLVFSKSVHMPSYMEAIQLGALDYIEKPSSPSVIGDLVAKHLRGQSGTA